MIRLRLIDASIQAARDVSAAIFPKTCAISGHWLHSSAGMIEPHFARHLVKASTISYCPRCGRTARPETIRENTCGTCRNESFWNLRAIARVAIYDAVLQRLLLPIKLGGNEANAAFVGTLMARQLKRVAWIEDVDALQPVPMHWLRRLQRPCRHADMLADEISTKTGIPVIKAVKQKRFNASQVCATTAAEKFRNVKGVFHVRSPSRVAGKRVCIVDNILTSGATLCEVSKELQRAGAKAIYAVVAGRAELPSKNTPSAPLPI